MIDLEIRRETEKALHLSDGVIEGWVAKSLIENYDDDWEIGQTVEVEIPEWLAEDLGWV